MKQNLMRFAVALAAIQSKFVHVQSICPVTFNATCASVNKGSASYVSFQVDENSLNAGVETYETTVTFKWGDSDNSYTYTDSYAIGELIKINNTHVYNETGIYPAGYTIIFGRGSGACENYTSTSISLIRIEERSCNWGIKTAAPSNEPSSANATFSEASNSTTNDSEQAPVPMISRTWAPSSAPVEPANSNSEASEASSEAAIICQGSVSVLVVCYAMLFATDIIG